MTQTNTTYTYIAEIDRGLGGRTTITAASLDEALDAAEDWCRDGDWDTSEGTIWCQVVVFREDDADEWAERALAIDPPEPPCRKGQEHDWRDSDVVGHGGGAIIHEVCTHCGVRRITDTWAHDPETGRQGLVSVRYERD